MIPQRADILPRSVASSEAASIGKGILLPLDQTCNHLIGIKDVAKPLNGISGEIRDQWPYMTHFTATRYQFESLLSPFARGNVAGSRDGYGAFDFSLLSGARRKNATRETTSPLKMWLHEHSKNPYPTKAEKIMLAIVTKMTLTQISTWFANARRRLKKDNKMTWCPRNKSSDKRDSSLKGAKQPPDDNMKSTGSTVDGEYMAGDDHDRRPRASDACFSDDVFSEDGHCDGDKKMAVHDDESAKDKNGVSRKLSQESFLKKINFGGNNSPVGNLQRWVDGHFGNQSPIDFPRELTPPRTPVEEIISSGMHTGGKENFKSKDSSYNVIQDVENLKKVKENALKGKPSVSSLSNSGERFKRSESQSSELSSISNSSDEHLSEALEQSEVVFDKKFRSCGLTSHREIDAVLALTSLASK